MKDFLTKKNVLMTHCCPRSTFTFIFN